MPSRVGSIGDKISYGNYAYCASKAAHNNTGKSIACELGGEDMLVMLMHPGYVRTGLDKSS